jgi:hypothetical protein
VAPFDPSASSPRSRVTTGYDDFVRDAVAFDVFGVRPDAASLEDIVRSKEATDRPQDRQDVVIIREMLRRRR